MLTQELSMSDGRAAQSVTSGLEGIEKGKEVQEHTKENSRKEGTGRWFATSLRPVWVYLYVCTLGQDRVKYVKEEKGPNEC